MNERIHDKLLFSGDLRLAVTNCLCGAKDSANFKWNWNF